MNTSRFVTNAKVCYVIAAWCGDRHYPDNHRERAIDYLVAHFAQLDKYQHNLTNITVSHPGPITDPEYRQCVQDFLATHPNATLLEYPNPRRSYGSWENAYIIHRDKFDYYILVEDDYAPAIDNFDSHLVGLMEERPGGGYVCGAVTKIDGLPWDIASISNGIVHRASCDYVWNRYKRLFRRADNPSYAVNQQEFSMAFSSLKLPITEWTHKFCSPYWHSSLCKVVEYAPEMSDYLIVPYQML